MEVEVLKSEGNLLELRLRGERHSLPNLLKAKLLEDSGVKFAAYTLDHPLDKDSRMVVRTAGKQPQAAVLKALTEIEKDIGELQKSFKKAFK